MPTKKPAPRVVARWDGGMADALRAALRMSNERFAGHLGVAVRTVAIWRARPTVVPREPLQEVLDVALANASTGDQQRFWLLAGARRVPVRVDQREDVTARFEAPAFVGGEPR